jgi:hypothetical protein
MGTYFSAFCILGIICEMGSSSAEAVIGSGYIGSFELPVGERLRLSTFSDTQ